MNRYSRWLIFAPVAILALFAPSAKADVLGDWTYSQSRDCGGSVEVVDNTIILHGPDNGTQQFGMCGGQANWVKIETTIPAGVDTVDFTWAYQTNDGWVYDPPQYGINGVYTLITQQNNVSGTKSVPVVEGDIFTFRQYSVDTCCQPGNLTISNLSLWQFTATTSTTVSDTSIPSDTTIPTETTWESTTTFTTQQTTTSTIAQSTTVPATTVPISTIPQTTYTIPVEPTMPDPPATVPLPQIYEPTPIETMPLPPEIETFPPETLELPPYIVDTMPFPVDTYPTIEPPDTLPFVGELPGPPDTIELPPDTMPEPPVILPIELIEELPPELVQALEDAGFTDIPLTEEEFTTAVEAIADLGTEEAVALIEQILATAVTPNQATELASNPDVLAVVTSEQAEEIFATIDVTELDNTQIDALVAAVQSAPVTVRKAFEKTINVFDDGLGDYVPIGSNVPVDTRRTLIAVAAGAATVAAGQRRGK